MYHLTQHAWVSAFLAVLVIVSPQLALLAIGRRVSGGAWQHSFSFYLAGSYHWSTWGKDELQSWVGFSLLPTGRKGFWDRNSVFFSLIWHLNILLNKLLSGNSGYCYHFPCSFISLASKEVSCLKYYFFRQKVFRILALMKEVACASSVGEGECNPMWVGVWADWRHQVSGEWARPQLNSHGRRLVAAQLQQHVCSFEWK